MDRKRVVLAGVLAVVYPGLGHVYLREWLRAITWFVLAVVTAAMVMPESVSEAFRAGGFSALVEASSRLPLEVVAALFAVRLLNVADAVWLAVRKTTVREAEAGVTCPHCGGELDEDLDFCHWCTTPLDAGRPEEAAADQRPSR